MRATNLYSCNVIQLYRRHYSSDVCIAVECIAVYTSIWNLYWRLFIFTSAMTFTCTYVNLEAQMYLIMTCYLVQLRHRLFWHLFCKHEHQTWTSWLPLPLCWVDLFGGTWEEAMASFEHRDVYRSTANQSARNWIQSTYFCFRRQKHFTAVIHMYVTSD